MLALMTVRYRFVSRRLCKHATAGVWVKQCRVYTISTCATWGQINNPGFLARDATKRVGAQWWDSKQIQINPSRIDLGFILPSKGIREKTGDNVRGLVIQLKQDRTVPESFLLPLAAEISLLSFPSVSLARAKTKTRWPSHQRAE